MTTSHLFGNASLRSTHNASLVPVTPRHFAASNRPFGWLPT